jgi:hypothetical protein
MINRRRKRACISIEQIEGPIKRLRTCLIPKLGGMRLLGPGTDGFHGAGLERLMETVADAEMLATLSSINLQQMTWSAISSISMAYIRCH